MAEKLQAKHFKEPLDELAFDLLIKLFDILNFPPRYNFKPSLGLIWSELTCFDRTIRKNCKADI